MRNAHVIIFILFAVQFSSQTNSGTKESPRIVCDYPVFPSFPGGENAFSEYLKANVHYPDSARKYRKQGTVYVYFEIDTSGAVGNSKIHKGVEGAPEIDAEALRVIATMPNWNPGTYDDILRMTVPIKFSLNEATPTVISCDTTIYKFVEEMPTFHGGESEFQNYLKQNLYWPDNATGGSAYASFIVKCDGTISDVSCVGGDPYFGEECVRVISAMPMWNPGRMNGKPVNVKIVVPIRVLPK